MKINKWVLCLITVVAGVFLLSGCAKADELTDTTWTAVSAKYRDRTLKGEELDEALGGQAQIYFNKKHVAEMKFLEDAGYATYEIADGIVTITTKDGEIFTATLDGEKLILDFGDTQITFEQAETPQTANQASGDIKQENNIENDGAVVFTASFDTGNYICGVDFPAGTYTITATNGIGSIAYGQLNDELPRTTRMSLEKQDLTETEITATFTKDMRLMVTGALSIKCESRDADPNEEILGRPENKDQAQVTLTTGEYVAGRDFEAGEYDIIAQGPEGQVYTEGFYFGGVSEMLSINGEENTVKEVKNVVLNEETRIIVDGTTILLR
ncbi:MAG: hypothetical protein LBQ95_07935 [Lachnospiraceae bacterium]|nr:hypothetical protein [Lachnospiraceae bacterium]